jgi:hypothetical protein
MAALFRLKPYARATPQKIGNPFIMLAARLFWNAFGW